MHMKFITFRMTSYEQTNKKPTEGGRSLQSNLLRYHMLYSILYLIIYSDSSIPSADANILLTSLLITGSLKLRVRHVCVPCRVSLCSLLSTAAKMATLISFWKSKEGNESKTLNSWKIKTPHFCCLFSRQPVFYSLFFFTSHHWVVMEMEPQLELIRWVLQPFHISLGLLFY